MPLSLGPHVLFLSWGAIALGPGQSSQLWVVWARLPEPTKLCPSSLRSLCDTTCDSGLCVLRDKEAAVFCLILICASKTNRCRHFIESEKDLRYVGKILDGFSLASKPLSSKKVRIFFFTGLVLKIFAV